MPLLVEIEQQETLERNQIRGGLEKLRKDTLNLEERDYASATVYGSASIATLLPTLVKYLREKKEKRKLTADGSPISTYTAINASLVMVLYY